MSLCACEKRLLETPFGLPLAPPLGGAIPQEYQNHALILIFNRPSPRLHGVRRPLHRALLRKNPENRQRRFHFAPAVKKALQSQALPHSETASGEVAEWSKALPC
jgi:hypothetical protein